jgi:hypothetical protein
MAAGSAGIVAARKFALTRRERGPILSAPSVGGEANMRNTSRRDTLKLGAAGLAGAMLAGRPGAAVAAEPPKAPSGHVIAAMSAATETVDPHFSRS